LGLLFFFPIAKWPLKNNHWDDHILQGARKKRRKTLNPKHRGKKSKKTEKEKEKEKKEKKILL
jgi:hypothetical protein